MLLSHTPDLAYKSAAQQWDFMLCGHNHGGQVQLPVIGPVLMPSRFSRRFERGFYQIDPDAHVREPGGRRQAPDPLRLHS